MHKGTKRRGRYDDAAAYDGRLLRFMPLTRAYLVTVKNARRIRHWVCPGRPRAT